MSTLHHHRRHRLQLPMLDHNRMPMMYFALSILLFYFGINIIKKAKAVAEAKEALSGKTIKFKYIVLYILIFVFFQAIKASLKSTADADVNAVSIKQTDFFRNSFDVSIIEFRLVLLRCRFVNVSV